MNEWKCRTAPSLGGGFDGTPLSAWGTVPNYDPSEEEPVIFFGLYGFPDFFALWRHKGRRAILWAGSDILHFINGYWLDEEGLIRMDNGALAKWMNLNCENYVENVVEQDLLMKCGIFASVVPSFLGNVKEYGESFIPSDRPKVYISSGKDRQEEYGFGIIERIAPFCEVDFYLYGADWTTVQPNIFVRGRIPISEMNEEVKNMQAGLRLNEMDGFSEILAKSILWGQYPISRIPYNLIDTYQTDEELISLLNNLKEKKESNREAREWYRENINKYPWNGNNK